MVITESSVITFKTFDLILFASFLAYWCSLLLILLVFVFLISFQSTKFTEAQTEQCWPTWPLELPFRPALPQGHIQQENTRVSVNQWHHTASWSSPCAWGLCSIRVVNQASHLIRIYKKVNVKFPSYTKIWLFLELYCIFNPSKYFIFTDCIIYILQSLSYPQAGSGHYISLHKINCL